MNLVQISEKRFLEFIEHEKAAKRLERFVDFYLSDVKHKIPLDRYQDTCLRCRVESVLEIQNTHPFNGYTE